MTTDPNPDRYRRRTEIKARQWTGSNTDAMSVFCSPFDFQTIDPEDRVEDPDQTAAVRTHPHGGWVGLKPGDWVVREAGRYTTASDEEFRTDWEPVPAAVSVVPPATNQAALLAEDLRYVLGHHEPGHAHEEPGVWDLSGEPCGHCARLAVARGNLAAYDGDPDAVLPAPVDQTAEEHRLALSEALGLGTGAPWDAIHDRVTELGLPPLDRDPVARRLGLLAAYRAAVLTEAADAVFALDYDAMVGEEGDENLGSMREAWDLGTIHAEKLLRRLAAEAPHTETPDEALHCVCGDPVQLMDDSDPTSWIHSPGSDTRCLEARPRCPHCQMPHDLTPGSPPVAVCASTRHRIAEAERLHPQGDHSLCCRVDCDAIPAPAVVAQPGKENDRG